MGPSARKGPSAHGGPITSDEEPRRRVAAVVAYDGRPFRGFAHQPGQRTVAGELAEALERVGGHEVEITCAGRTDAGVHAWGQVVHFDTAAGVDLVALKRSCNKMLAPAIVLREVAEADPQFDARRSATARRYRYVLLTAPLPDPFLAGLAWHVERPLDLRALRLGCDPLLGEHDFAAFCRRPKAPVGGEGTAPEPSLVRRVTDATWRKGPGDLLYFEIEANAFCHQMVRSVVGTLVDVGCGRRKAGHVASILASRDRSTAGQLAPPDGLYLLHVSYAPTGSAPLPGPAHSTPQRGEVADVPRSPYR